jgi:hypothetical protein
MTYFRWHKTYFRQFLAVENDFRYYSDSPRGHHRWQGIGNFAIIICGIHQYVIGPTNHRHE